jgi:hypothetical protein
MISISKIPAGGAMDNEQTNFNPSTASTESNKYKTRSEHSVDKTNETTIHENADKEAENVSTLGINNDK